MTMQRCAALLLAIALQAGQLCAADSEGAGADWEASSSDGSTSGGSSTGMSGSMYTWQWLLLVAGIIAGCVAAVGGAFAFMKKDKGKGSKSKPKPQQPDVVFENQYSPQQAPLPTTATELPAYKPAMPVPVAQVAPPPTGAAPLVLPMPISAGSAAVATPAAAPAVGTASSYAFPTTVQAAGSTGGYNVLPQGASGYFLAPGATQQVALPSYISSAASAGSASYLLPGASSLPTPAPSASGGGVYAMDLTQFNLNLANTGGYSLGPSAGGASPVFSGGASPAFAAGGYSMPPAPAAGGYSLQ